MHIPWIGKPTLRLSLVWISLWLVGCASTKESVLPQDGPTMKTLYDHHMAAMQQTNPPIHGGQPLPPSGIAHYRGFVREAANEIETHFPRLPNPTLVMYIFPHLSGNERTPVPGYVTTFPFYEKVEYALPGEVPGLLMERLVEDALSNVTKDTTPSAINSATDKAKTHPPMIPVKTP